MPDHLSGAISAVEARIAAEHFHALWTEAMAGPAHEHEWEQAYDLARFGTERDSRVWRCLPCGEVVDYDAHHPAPPATRR